MDAKRVKFRKQDELYKIVISKLISDLEQFQSS